MCTVLEYLLVRSDKVPEHLLVRFGAVSEHSHAILIIIINYLKKPYVLRNSIININHNIILGFFLFYLL